jgi:hypothetical protein
VCFRGDNVQFQFGAPLFLFGVLAGSKFQVQLEVGFGWGDQLGSEQDLQLKVVVSINNMASSIIGTTNGHSGRLGSQSGSFEAIPAEISIELIDSTMKQQKRPRASQAPLISVVLVFIALGLIYLQQSAFFNAVRLSGATLLAQADPILKNKLQAIAEAGPYIKCSATGLQSKSMDDFAPSKKVLGKLDHLPSTPGKIKGNKFVELLIQDAPCW